MQYSQQDFMQSREQQPAAPEVDLGDQMITSDDAWTVIKAYF